MNNQESTQGRYLILKRKKVKLLTNKQPESHEDSKICFICKEQFEDKYAKDRKYCRVRHHCYYTGEYRGAAHSICYLKYSVLKENHIVFHNESMVFVLSQES